MERDKGGHGKDVVNIAQVNGRASGVACNALLGGPGAALTLGYMARVARQRIYMRRSARGAIAAWCSRPRRRRAHISARLLRSGWRNEATMSVQ